MNNWTIRMKHTSLSEYRTCSLEAIGWTEVYKNNETINSTGWRSFVFQTPFEYNGTDNLLVDFSHNNSSYTQNGECKVSNTGGRRSAYTCSDSHHGDPLNWSGATSPTVSCSNNVPNVKLTICRKENKLTPENGEAGDYFGYESSVSIAGDYAIIGAYCDDDKGTDSGSAYVYFIGEWP